MRCPSPPWRHGNAALSATHDLHQAFLDQSQAAFKGKRETHQHTT